MKNILWKYKDSKYYMYREKKQKTNLDQWKELMVFEILMFEITKYHIDNDKKSISYMYYEF